jgi:hypothetical protein
MVPLRHGSGMSHGMMRFRSLVDRMLPRHDTVENPNGKKSIPAWRAAIRGKPEQAEQPGHGARSVLAGNALQVHIAAHAAMHVANVAYRSRPGIKTQIAAAAPPRAQERYPNQVVQHAAPAGAARTVAMAGWTNQSRSPLVISQQRIREALFARQVRSAAS